LTRVRNASPMSRFLPETRNGMLASAVLFSGRPFDLS
jgi:hypothetical protein